MKVIGLTGGIASGKSKVASLLASWGAVVIDSDLVAHRVMERGKRVQEKIRLHFGKRVFREGRIDRIALGRIVFRHPAERKALEAIVHPQVKRILSRRTKELERKGEPFLFLEIPLLFEVGWQKRMDEVWLVYAPPAQQIVRLHDRDHLEEKEVQRRLAAQLPWEEKLKGATRIIDNSGSWEHTARQVRELFLGLSER
jgi:dephospho-CoA kinase